MRCSKNNPLFFNHCLDTLSFSSYFQVLQFMGRYINSYSLQFYLFILLCIHLIFLFFLTCPSSLSTHCDYIWRLVDRPAGDQLGSPRRIIKIKKKVISKRCEMVVNNEKMIKLHYRQLMQCVIKGHVNKTSQIPYQLIHILRFHVDHILYFY